MGKILIIEDDPYVRRFYERLFSLEKFEVMMAESGEEGLEKVKTFQPKLILLDIMMPTMNGLDVLEKLKGDDATKNTVIVMLTNIGDEQTISKAISLGADGFIVKSNLEPEELISTVNKYMES